MISRKALVLLTCGVLFLPMAIVLLAGTAQLSAALGDSAGATTLGRIALALGILWVLGLIALLVALAIDALLRGDNEGREG